MRIVSPRASKGQRESNLSLEHICFDRFRPTALKGLGTAVALPLLDGMPSIVDAAGPTSSSSKPIRAVFLYVPNGVHVPDWTPEQSGSAYALPWILEPLTPFKKDINVLTGLTLDKARPNGDGPGDHARDGGVPYRPATS